jgi:hypothetical protein
VHYPSIEGDHHGTSAERMRAYRERARRGLRRFTISVSADDLTVIAEHGYEGAASTDQDSRSQAIDGRLSRLHRLKRSCSARLRRNTGMAAQLLHRNGGVAAQRQRS